MITMATNPFCESMGQRVTYMEQFIPTNTRSVFPIDETNSAQNMFSSTCHPTTDRRPQKGENGNVEYIFHTVRGPPPQSVDKPRGKAYRSGSCSSPDPVAMSGILRGL